jgi:hypothetical protein
VPGSIFHPLDFHQFSLSILVGIKLSIEFAALIANTILIHQGAGVVEDPNHRLSRVAERIDWCGR